jgi:stage IV sporulation protein FB
MLEWKWREVTLRLSVLFPISVVVLLSLDASRVTELCLFASLLHELGHAFAMYITHDRPSCITMGFFGVRIERATTKRMSYRSSCLVSLAGPLVNVLFFVLFILLENDTAASVHAVIGGFNLLPIYSLDGGEALSAMLCMYYDEEKSEKIVGWVSLLTLVPLSAFACCLFLNSGYNFSLLAVSVYLILLIFLRYKH